MAAPQIVALPPFITLGPGYTVRVTAVDALTNATVSGVVVSGVSIDVNPSADLALNVAVPNVGPDYFAGEAA